MGSRKSNVCIEALETFFFSFSTHGSTCASSFLAHVLLTHFSLGNIGIAPLGTCLCSWLYLQVSFLALGSTY